MMHATRGKKLVATAVALALALSLALPALAFATTYTVKFETVSSQTQPGYTSSLSVSKGRLWLLWMLGQVQHNEGGTITINHVTYRSSAYQYLSINPASSGKVAFLMNTLVYNPAIRDQNVSLGTATSITAANAKKMANDIIYSRVHSYSIGRRHIHGRWRVYRDGVRTSRYMDTAHFDVVTSLSVW